MSKISRGLVAAGALAALAFGLSPMTVAGAAQEPTPPPECAPTNQFSLNITNPYSPMSPGQVSTFLGFEEGEGGEPGEWLGLRITVLKKTENFYKGRNRIVTRVVEEVEWVDENQDGEVDRDEDLIEVSRNFFAQTDAGTVCYFGETVDIYGDSGRVESHEGSWRADAPGNAPGIFMPASPDVGDTFQIEFAPQVAMDEATVQAFETVTVPYDEFANALKVRDCNPLEPGQGSCGIKYYALGAGLIVDGAVQLTRFEPGTPVGSAKRG